uniref:adenosine deaminase n=1 Tax=Heligmosomoides polygyrus TaxID=6339 RepID=A0A183FTQ0_HELPZ
LARNLLRNTEPNAMVTVPTVTEQSEKDLSFPKVVLHLHLDGSIRFSTLLELSLPHGTPLKGAKTVEKLKKVTHESANLSKLLEAFDLFLPVVRGDKVAIERIAYEMCDDQAADGVVYFEGRYSPHLLCLPGGELTPKGIVEAKMIAEKRNSNSPGGMPVLVGHDWAVPLDWKDHPVATWAKDKVNFSISRDDPTCFDSTMLSELHLVQHEVGLSPHQLWQCQLNAARSCILPEKRPIVEKILAAEPKSH